MVRMANDGWISRKLDDGITVHIKVGRGSRGEVITTGLLVEAPEVTTDTLRQLQPARLLAGIPEAALRLVSLAPGPDDDTTIGKLRARATPKARAPKRKNLGRPDGSDDFYRGVAQSYRSAAMETSHPAMLLAEENSVPVETVRRWIKEARRRGHLEAGRKGRAG